MTLPDWFWDVVPYAREIRWYRKEQARLRARGELIKPILAMELLPYTYAELIEAATTDVPWAIERDAIYVARVLHCRTGRGTTTLPEAIAAMKKNVHARGLK